MLVNTMIKELEEVKKNVCDCFDEYKAILTKDDNDLLSILYVYSMIKHRDNLSFNADSNGFRTKVFNLAKTTVDVLNSQYNLNLDLAEINKSIGKVHNDTKNKGIDHFNCVNEAITSAMEDIRKSINNVDDSSNVIVDEVIEEFSSGISRDVKDLLNIVNRGLSANFNLYDYYKTLIDYNTKEPINQRIAFMITDCIGNRDENIGVYIGMTRDHKFFVIPQGAGYINRNFNKYYTSGARYFDTFIEAAQCAIVYLRDFYSLKSNRETN